MTGVSLIAAGAGFILWSTSYFATNTDLMNLRAEVSVVKLQTEDVLDARIQFISKEIGRLEDRRKRNGDLTATEINYLNDLNREYERLRKLRYGKQ